MDPKLSSTQLVHELLELSRSFTEEQQQQGPPENTLENLDLTSERTGREIFHEVFQLSTSINEQDTTPRSPGLFKTAASKIINN